MSRQSNTGARREQIVGALERVMAKRGYDGASIATIASAAGLTQGLVHYHFRSKQEILLSLIERLAATVRDRAARAAGDAPRDRLAALIDAYLALDGAGDPSKVACWVTIGAEALRQPGVRELYAGAVAESTAALAAAIRDVLVAERRSTRNAAAVAAGVMAAIEGYLLMSVAAPGSVPRGSAARTLRAMVSGAIDAEPARSS